MQRNFILLVSQMDTNNIMVRYTSVMGVCLVFITNWLYEIISVMFQMNDWCSYSMAWWLSRASRAMSRAMTAMMKIYKVLERRFSTASITSPSVA